MSRLELKEEIFKALQYLHEENKNNPRNILTCVVDRQAEFYFYYETNGLFFWHEKDPKDFIKLTDSENPFWDEHNAPEKWEDIADSIEEYEMFIYEHFTFDFPQKPYLKQKILGKQHKLRMPLKKSIISAQDFAKKSKTPNIYNTKKEKISEFKYKTIRVRLFEIFYRHPEKYSWHSFDQIYAKSKRDALWLVDDSLVFNETFKGKVLLRAKQLIIESLVFSFSENFEKVRVFTIEGLELFKEENEKHLKEYLSIKYLQGGEVKKSSE